MGNAQSDVTNNVKAQADAHENAAYRLVDVKGGGELVKLMKDPELRHNKAKLDEEIRKRILPCLYEAGHGQDVLIQEIVYHRSTNKEKFKRYRKQSFLNLGRLVGRENESLNKRVCWDVEKRGAVGETPLHLCLLCGSTLHKELAKKMIRLFPQLVDDVYLSDEYYGENALHMAIVNEDANMVKFLLIHNVDIHQRCSGKFFCPDDQKKGRQDVLVQENPLLPLKTNYFGLSYYGEYPLSFAAVMDQYDCVRLLFAKRVNPNKQDSNGNTVLHMLVIHNKLEMFDLLISFGAKLDIKNRQNYTPLTLAAKLGRATLFEYILKRMRNVYWVYADIACAAYPLTNLDTISEDGSTDSNSVVYSLVNSDTVDHLKLFDGLVLDLLQQKWNKFVKIRFFIELLFFIGLFGISCTSMYLKRSYLTYLIETKLSASVSANVSMNATSTNYFNCLDISEKGVFIKTECDCIFLNPIDPDRYVRSVFEVLTILLALTALGLAVKELYIEKFKLYLNILMGNPTKFFYLIACLIILLIIPFRFTCDHSTEDILCVVALIFLTIHFLYYCRGFRSIGPVVLMVQKMVGGDLMRFFIIYSVFLMGFSQAMYIASDYGLEDDTAPMFRSPIESLFYMFIVSLGEFKDVYERFDFVRYEVLSKIILLIYMLIVGLLLLNLLIAMMGNTYGEINESKNEWLRQWAKVVLAVEQSVVHKDRLKYQKRYSNQLEDGQQGFVVRWKQTDTEREEFVNNKNAYRTFVDSIPENNVIIEQ